MLRRSFFRSLFWMNLATYGLRADKGVTPKNSKVIVCAFLFVAVLICSRGQAQFSVTGTADPTSIIWGHDSEITAVASGGTPGYFYGFDRYCSSSQPPTIVPFPDPNFDSIEYCFGETGSWSIICVASDSAGPPVNIAQDTVIVTVLKPNKIVLLDSLFEDDVTFVGQQVTFQADLEFEVRRDNEAVGDCAAACVQTKIWKNPPETEASTPWFPTICGSGTYTLAWGPPTVNLQIGFSVSLSEWNAADQLEVVDTKFCRVKVNYHECDGTVNELPSNVFRADFRKKTGTIGQVVLTRAN